MAVMHPFNETLHKQALTRRREIRAMLKGGRTMQSVATQLGISRERVRQIRNGKAKRNGRKA